MTLRQQPGPARNSPASDALATDPLFEQQLDRALSAAPQVAVPEDFARRLAAQFHASAAPVPRRQAHVGRWTTGASAAALLIAVLLLAPTAAHGSPYAALLESALAFEFAFLIAGARSWRSVVQKTL